MHRSRHRLLPGIAFLLTAATMILAWDTSIAFARGDVDVTEFLPVDYVRDGSLSYQPEVQAALDAASNRGGFVRFPAMKWAINENGWKLNSGLTIDMRGSTFVLDTDCKQDGAVFHGENVSNVTLIGGTIIGWNQQWGDGINIRGVQLTGASNLIRIRDMQMRDLSSNGIGIFGSAESTTRDVWIENVVVENCCKRYPDYLSGEKPETGSVREDQGDVALYYVHDFVVQGCRFERSRSDGTHFYHCRNGQITGNRIYRAKMGGYFLEGCENIVGQGNVILENGSRGSTIERGSRNCVFSQNVVSLSGREGLWAPDCVGLVITGNIFDRNGRKPNGDQPKYIWNANITINEASVDPSQSPTQNYLVSNNMITTTASQIAAIRVDAVTNTKAIVIRDNVLLGETSEIIVEGVANDEVALTGNGQTGGAK